MKIKLQKVFDAGFYFLLRIMFCFLHRNTFSGKMSAYGASNDDTLNTVKAGPGTIFLKEGNQLLLTVSGDTDSSVQKQTYTYISGDTNQFTYDKLVLDGNININVCSLNIWKTKLLTILVLNFEQGHLTTC